MSYLIVMCGLPGSGKTSYIQNNLTSNGETIVSMDMIRKEVFGDSRCQRDNNLIAKLAMYRVKSLLSDGEIVVFDATSITKQYRANFINIAKDLGLKSTIIYKKMNLDDLLTINKYRDDPIPERVLCNIRFKLEEPSDDEADLVLHV